MGLNMSNLGTDQENGQRIINELEASKKNQNPSMQITKDPGIEDEVQREIAEKGIENVDLGVTAPKVEPAVNAALAQAQDNEQSYQGQAMEEPQQNIIDGIDAEVKLIAFNANQAIKSLIQSQLISQWLVEFDETIMRLIGASESNIETTKIFFHRTAVGDSIRELWMILTELQAVCENLDNTGKFLRTQLPEIQFCKMSENNEEQPTPYVEQGKLEELLIEINQVYCKARGTEFVLSSINSWLSRNPNLANEITVMTTISGVLLIGLPNTNNFDAVKPLLQVPMY